jgi:hypothetical protein
MLNVNKKSLSSGFSHYTPILIIGSIILAASIFGIIYSGSIVIRDETSHKIVGPNSLPKSGVGPISMYHVEYGLVFVSIAAFAAVMWGYAGRHEQSAGKH